MSRVTKVKQFYYFLSWASFKRKELNNPLLVKAEEHLRISRDGTTLSVATKPPRKRLKCQQRPTQEEVQHHQQ
jgi:hypothetical protein